MIPYKDKRGFRVSEKSKGRTLIDVTELQVCLRVTIMSEKDG